MAPLIVLVNGDPTARRRMESLLSGEGYMVAAASSFAEGRELLRSMKPDLLVAGVRLESFNGLHLAIDCITQQAGVPIVITHDRHDAVLERDAGRLGAAFIVNPTASAEFLPRIHSLIAQASTTPIRRWPRKHASATMAAQLEAFDASVVDVSYGGMRLAFSQEREVPTEFDVTLAAAGVTLHAQRVWTSRSPDTGEFWCGAEIRPTDDSVLTEWREFVDSMH